MRGPLRRLIADRLRVDRLIDMTNVPAFRGEVTADPAATILSRGVAPASRRGSLTRTSPK